MMTTPTLISSTIGDPLTANIPDEVIVDSTVVAGVTVLEELAASISVLDATKRCTEVTN